MASLSAVFCPVTGNATKLTIPATSASPLTSLPGNKFIITSDSDVYIAFGDAAMPLATTSWLPLCAKTYMTWNVNDMSVIDHISCYNPGASTANVWLYQLSM